MSRLTDLDILEVSLVDKAANKRKFLVLKSEGESDMNEVTLELNEGLEALFKSLAALVNTDKTVVTALEAVQKEDVRKSLASLEDEGVSNILKAAEDKDTKATLEGVIKKALPLSVISTMLKSADGEEEITKSDLSDNAKDAMRVAVRALKGAEADLPKDFMAKLTKAGGFKAPVDHTQIKKNEDGSLDLSGIPEDMRPAIEMLWKQSEAATEKADATEKVLKAERNERLNKEFVVKAEGYKNLSVEAVKFGPILKKVSESLTKEENEELIRVLQGADNSLTDLLKETGAGGSNDDGSNDDSAYGQLTKHAVVIAKRDKVTKEVAFVKAMDENPELAQKLQAEEDAA